MPQGITEKTPDKVVKRYQETGDKGIRRDRSLAQRNNLKDAGTKPLTRDATGLVDKPSQVTGNVRTTSPTGRQVESRLLTKAGKEAGLKVGTGLKSAKGRLSKPVVTKIESTASKTSEKTVTTRDAGNTKYLRGKLDTRALSAVSTPAPVKQSTPLTRAGVEAGKMVKGAATAMTAAAVNNPAVTAAYNIAEADKATGYKRTQYSGNFGGPSFSVNPYASINKSSSKSAPSMRSMLGMPKGK